MRTQAPHPAKFNDAVLEEIAFWLPEGTLTLDPFGGVGKLKEISKITAVRVEIEKDWADNVCADALHLPFRDATFDAVATSPVYGNRMSDHHNARDKSKRHTYKHYIGHDLHPHNAGQLQWGECLTPETRVLRSDWRWVPVGDLHVGDGLISCDEETKEGPPEIRRRGRRFREAKVESYDIEPREVVRVSFDDGTHVDCTPNHPWLVRWANSQWRWVQASALTDAYEVGVFIPTWGEDRSYDAGWLAGMFDGEGSLTYTNLSCALTLAQKPGPVLDRVVELLQRRGAYVVVDRSRPVHNVRVVGSAATRMALLGSIRPERLLTKARIDGLYMRTEGVRRVVGVKALGLRDVALMSTSTRTYFAEGMASHNSYRMFHRMAWTEVIRCLKPGGLFLLNCSDHIRNKKVVKVTAWHEKTLQRLGLAHVRTVQIGTDRLRHGDNHEARVDHETLSIFTKGA
jgi:hypothetical protein